MFRGYSEFLLLARDAIKDSINDYINYKKAQAILWKYHKRDNFCTACGIADSKTLESLSVVLEHEEILKNKIATKIRIKNSKKAA